MKKFFTLFALLSVGLSASAQTYTLTSRDLNFSEQMKNNGDGTFSLRKIFYLDFKKISEYTWEAGDWGWQFLSSSEHETGWYDLSFIYKPSNDNLSLTINERTSRSDIFLSDDATFGTYSLGYDPLEINYIEYTRSCKNEWGTLCLPFDFKPFYAYQFKDVTYYELKSATDEALVFSPIDASTSWVNAGTPLVFKLNNSNSDLIVKAWDIYSLNSQASTSDVIEGWKLNGTVEGTTIDAGWVMQSNEIRKVAENGFPIKPYRAWFTGERPSGAPLRISVDETEGLQFVEQEDGTVKVSYDLQGRKLDDARKGLKIENGKVIMVK
jgi:hypothetical protein